MAKGTAVCKCKVCGKEFEREFTGINRKAVDWKIKCAEEDTEAMCPDCWKAQQRAKEVAAGLNCTVRVILAHNKEKETSVRFYAIFSGDTWGHKAQLKEAGCMWTDTYPSSKYGSSIEGLEAIDNKKTWVYISDTLESVQDLIKTMGAIATYPTDDALAVASAVRGEKRAKKLTVSEAIEALAMMTREYQFPIILSLCSVATLRVLAKIMEVKVPSTLRRAELIEALTKDAKGVISAPASKRDDRLQTRVRRYYLSQALKKAKTQEVWDKAWSDLANEYPCRFTDDIKRKYLMRCTKRKLVAFLDGSYSMKQRKDSIVADFLGMKKAA